MNHSREQELLEIIKDLREELKYRRANNKYRSFYLGLIDDEDYLNSERYLRDREEVAERVNPVPQDITLKGIEQALYELINIMRQKQAGTYSPISIFKGAKK